MTAPSRLAIHEAGHICADIYLGADTITLHCFESTVEVRSDLDLDPNCAILMVNNTLSLMAGAVAEIPRDCVVSSLEDVAALAPIWAGYDYKNIREVQLEQGWADELVMSFFATAQGIISEDTVIEMAARIDPVIASLRDGESAVVFSRNGGSA